MNTSYHIIPFLKPSINLLFQSMLYIYLFKLKIDKKYYISKADSYIYYWDIYKSSSSILFISYSFSLNWLCFSYQKLTSFFY